MFFAILIVFLVLAAQFESFRDPIVILVSVPLALFGALIFINLGFTTLNVYTQVGLVTLMGLISKHGILIVEFANELQEAGRSKLDAIVEASSVRLRPILMTTAAMVAAPIGSDLCDTSKLRATLVHLTLKPPSTQTHGH